MNWIFVWIVIINFSSNMLESNMNSGLLYIFFDVLLTSKMVYKFVKIPPIKTYHQSIMYNYLQIKLENSNIGPVISDLIH